MEQSGTSALLQGAVQDIASDVVSALRGGDHVRMSGTAAMNDVDPGESGLASGVVNTSFMMGGSLGLAALASLSEARGYHAAFAAGALFAFAAALATVFLDSRRARKPAMASS